MELRNRRKLLGTYSHYKGDIDMNNLQKKELLKRNFKKLKENKNDQKIISFKELNITFQRETFEVYRALNGGAKCE